MTSTWTAEVVVSKALAQSLLAEQFPDLGSVRLERLGAGMDNTAFQVNGAYVFRFPRRQFAVPFLEAETRLLPALAPLLPLPVPVPTFVGRPTEAYPWPFAGYPLLLGRTACAATLNEQQRTAAAQPLARFLAALHAVPADEAVRLGAGHDSICRLDLARRVPRAQETLHQLAQRRLIEDIHPFLALLDDAPDSYVPRTDTLVHGDLYFRHLLVNADNQLAGVIDWGDVHLGDPAVDLAIALTFLPPKAEEVFRRSYGPIVPLTWQIARLRALWHSVTVLLYGHDIEDADLVRESRLALQYLARD